MIGLLPAIYFGGQPQAGGTDYNFSDISQPVHTRVIEVLEEALRNEVPFVPVWPDQSMSSPDVDHLVVANLGSDWQMTASLRTRRSTLIGIYAYSKSSGGAEKLVDKVARIIRMTNRLTFMSADEMPGGRLENGECYYRVLQVRVRSGV